jgi:hypothetical protein
MKNYIEGKCPLNCPHKSNAESVEQNEGMRMNEVQRERERERMSRKWTTQSK